MSRVPSLSSPFLLGFDEIERLLDRVAKGGDGYPPYNIERLARDPSNPERLRITLAVAGFTRDQTGAFTPFLVGLAVLVALVTVAVAMMRAPHKGVATLPRENAA